jgi:hypothetical protein
MNKHFRQEYSPEARVYNLDETGISIVVRLQTFVAQLGTQQVGQVVSGDQGTVITVCMIVNTVGNAIPPVFVFLRARFNYTMLFGAPPGSLGSSTVHKVAG